MRYWFGRRDFFGLPKAHGESSSRRACPRKMMGSSNPGSSRGSGGCDVDLVLRLRACASAPPLGIGSLGARWRRARFDWGVLVARQLCEKAASPGKADGGEPGGV